MTATRRTMRFAEIPKYTADGHYEVHVGLKYLPDRITDWCDNLGLDTNPDFQRGHVWTGEQQIAFVEHLLRGGQSGKIYFNHPGWHRNFVGPFVLVDGLQRTTACLRFMRNELGVFGGYTYSDFTDRLHHNIGLCINVNDLKTRAEVLRWYLQINYAGTPHTPDELARVEALLSNELAE